MGLLISKFRGKKTTIEILEQIDKDINKLQKNRKENQEKQKRLVTTLLIYSILLYVIGAVVFFLLYLPDTWPLRFLYSSPLLVFPFLIWGAKKLLHWYFVKRIASNDLALRKLREQKKSILEDVMETETYKKAKEILEKFDPVRFKKLEGQNETPQPSPPASGTSGTALHQRKPPTPASAPASTPRLPRAAPMPRPRQPFAPAVSNPSTPSMAAAGSPRPPGQGPHLRPALAPAMQATPMRVMPPGPPMPRSVLPRERGTMDRLMDYLVGDGPENRYALICNRCYSHNGMALKEEFEYLTFRCCYCYQINPARKQRPVAPRLEFFAPRGRGTLSDSQASAESDDEEESEEEEESQGKPKPGSTTDVSNSDTSADASSLQSNRQAPVGSQIPVNSASKKLGSGEVGGGKQSDGSSPRRQAASAGGGHSPVTPKQANSASLKPSRLPSARSSGASGKPEPPTEVPQAVANEDRHSHGSAAANAADGSSANRTEMQTSAANGPASTESNGVTSVDSSVENGELNGIGFVDDLSGGEGGDAGGRSRSHLGIAQGSSDTSGHSVGGEEVTGDAQGKEAKAGVGGENGEQGSSVAEVKSPNSVES